jgi:flagellar biosynthesis GTPase FlhF
VNPYLVLAGIAAVGIFGGVSYYQGYESGQKAVQQSWDKEKAQQYAQYAKGQEESRKREQELQSTANKLRQEKDREIREIAARNAALANSLRDRQSRPAANASAVPSAASVGPSACTGKELYREDGEFLVRLAGEADEVRAALKQCYAQYQAIK